MKTRLVNTAIIGAGSAGLSALKQVKQSTDDYVLIDPGPLGTTCARVGCMPSKVLIQVANSYHHRHHLAACGIQGGKNLLCDIPSALRYVRVMRDKFTEGMQEVTRKRAGDRLITGKARFAGPDTLCVGKDTIRAERIIIAAGAHPLIPKQWVKFKDRILTSENIFEQNDLPKRMAVIGLGAIGLELGQALSRLGIEVSGFNMDDHIGGLTDPRVYASAIRTISREFPLHCGQTAKIEEADEGLVILAGDTRMVADKVLVAIGVQPNLEGLGLEKLGVELDDRGLPHFDRRTLQVEDLPVFIAGDVNGCRPILHEAIDEGFIAGRNAASDESGTFCRRTPLRIVFSEPQIAVAGLSHEECKTREVVTGVADFSQQARAKIESRNAGLLHIYVDKSSSRLLGAEMAVPHAEHFAHQLALAISQEMTIKDLLDAPYYHPVGEEGVRSALRDAANKINMPTELGLCGSSPEDVLC